MANEVREALTAALEERQTALEEEALNRRLAAEALDVTIPGKAPRSGAPPPHVYRPGRAQGHSPRGHGLYRAGRTEVELAEYNFDKLNAEEGHPSRDWSDTFYFDQDSRVMLRSQTSPMQVRAMETMELPIRIIAPGRVYRKDEVDATIPHVPPG